MIENASGIRPRISTACYLAPSESRVRVRVRARIRSNDKALAAMMRCVSQSPGDVTTVGVRMSWKYPGQKQEQEHSDSLIEGPGNVIESRVAVTLCYSSSRAHGENLDSDWTIRRKDIMQDGREMEELEAVLRSGRP